MKKSILLTIYLIATIFSSVVISGENSCLKNGQTKNLRIKHFSEALKVGKGCDPNNLDPKNIENPDTLKNILENEAKHFADFDVPLLIELNLEADSLWKQMIQEKGSIKEAIRSWFKKSKPFSDDLMDRIISWKYNLILFFQTSHMNALDKWSLEKRFQISRSLRLSYDEFREMSYSKIRSLMDGELVLEGIHPLLFQATLEFISNYPIFYKSSRSKKRPINNDFYIGMVFFSTNFRQINPHRAFSQYGHVVEDNPEYNSYYQTFYNAGTFLSMINYRDCVDWGLSPIITGCALANAPVFGKSIERSPMYRLLDNFTHSCDLIDSFKAAYSSTKKYNSAMKNLCGSSSGSGSVAKLFRSVEPTKTVENQHWGIFDYMKKDFRFGTYDQIARILIYDFVR